MPSRLTYYRNHLSLGDAWRLYRHVKSKKDDFVKFSFLQHPAFIRGIMSDELMFGQLFIDKQYDVYYPIEATTIIDLGANVGYASVFFANKFPNARIVAVEPEANNYAVAQKNTAPYKNIQLLHGAVWYEPAQLDVVDNGFGEAAFMMVAQGAAAQHLPQGKVVNSIPAYTIAQLAETINATTIDIVKMDIEGSEKEIFEHPTNDWLPRTKMLIVETHDRYKKGTSKALMQAMSQYDFSLALSGENLLFYNNQLVAFNPPD
ncbi:MAG TPA: hypothetical protein DCL43_08775 [Chitinophagaceae bacterium]|nr:hypothetical protein [Chitinophagaceae bacterium]HAN37383.1 hypothetical protein [Chitinophagaceae bacterium]